MGRPGENTLVWMLTCYRTFLRTSFVLDGSTWGEYISLDVYMLQDIFEDISVVDGSTWGEYISLDVYMLQHRAKTCTRPKFIERVYFIKLFSWLASAQHKVVLSDFSVNNLGEFCVGYLFIIDVHALFKEIQLPGGPGAQAISVPACNVFCSNLQCWLTDSV